MSFLVKVFCYLSLFFFSHSSAKELNSHKYDARLCSAQLLVITGDLDRFLLTETKQIHKVGLKKRINGALGTLGWLCKQHNQQPNVLSTQKQIKTTRSAFANEDWEQVKQNLRLLISTLPLDTESFSSEQLTKKDLNTSISIYEHYCKTCHIHVNDKSETPAYPFKEMVKNMSREEFLARMLVGVHGTPKIALRNPLTDTDIAGLLSYFSKQIK